MSNRSNNKITAAPAPVIAPYEALAREICERLKQGAALNNPSLTAMANSHFGGTRGDGCYSPKDAYDAMETGLNLLLLEGGAEQLQQSFGDALRWLRRLTGQLATQVDRTEEQVEMQQFSSPPPFAFLAARLLSPQPGEVVIEPSAGTGNLAIWPRLMGAKVVTNELAERRRESLKMLGFDPFAVDAEHLDDLLPLDIKPSSVLMNPPFSATGGRVTRHDAAYGARHIDSVLRRLEAGGRVVAISGQSLAIGSAKFRPWWQRLAALYNVRANLTIAGKEFQKFGTQVDTQIIVIDKDGSTPGGTWAEQVKNIVWGSVGSPEEAWEKLKHLAARQPRIVAGESQSDEDHADLKTEAAVFAPYVVQRLRDGKAHPAAIVEAASMAAVVPPPVSYRPHLPLSVVTEGKLSIIQLENIIYAGQRHAQRLPNGERGGFMVGSGTGVGKGRILAGIIADNWYQGRRRALWLSVNNDLMPSTERDLRDIGAGHIALARINDYQADTEIGLAEGVIFASFSSLISKSKKGSTRLDQIQRWLGREGVVVIDEASKAKNAIGSGRGSDGTQTGQAVIDLQSAERNPDYRFVYASATGATDVRNMAYMQRFGLWGAGTAFPDGFHSFMNEVEQGGIGAMEMVSRDLKALGLYLSGSIDFGVDPTSGKAVEYSECVTQLTDGQREIYDCAARAWQHVLRNIEDAIKATGGGKRQRSAAMTKFWGDHQRFFNQLIMAFNVPGCITEAERALAADESVVISLINTGEARTRDQVAKAVASGNSLEDLDFSPREVIAQMVENGFPTVLHEDVQDPITGKVTQEIVTDENGTPVHCQEALRLKEQLLIGLSALQLPENPLDQIVNHFGESEVAELTGRTRRLIRDRKTGHVTYKKRAPEGIAMHAVNVHEMDQFQAGKKRIAVISGAASMGISLHASRSCLNQRRRCHITLQLGWSADVQMQVFGRTHRSDQAVPPRYVLMVMDIGGARRFCCTIAQRLASLGALTKGDRGAAGGGDLARFNFETEEGRSALTVMFHRIVRRSDSVPGLDDAKQVLRDIGLLVVNKDGIEAVKPEDERNVPRFLNRLLALDVARQNALFDFYSTIFDLTVLTAKQQGTFDEGVADIHAEAVRLAEAPHVLATDKVTGAQTILYMLDVDRRLSVCPFTEADEARRKLKDACYYRHVKTGKAVMAVPSRTHTDPDSGRVYRTFALWKPEGKRHQYRDQYEIEKSYKLIDEMEAQSLWEAQFEEVPKIETTRMAIIGGSVLPLWGRLRAEADSRLRVVRVTATSGQRIVGVQIESKSLNRTLQAVGVSSNTRTPEEVFDALMGGKRVNLVSGVYLFRVKVHREDRIEVGGVSYGDYGLLEREGIIKEKLGYTYHLFVPTLREKGIAVLGKLLERFPLYKTAQEVEAERQQRQQRQQQSDVGGHSLTSVETESVSVLDLIVPVTPPPVKEKEAVIAGPTVKTKNAGKEAKPAARAVTRPVAPPPAPEPPPKPIEYNRLGQGLLF